MSRIAPAIVFQQQDASQPLTRDQQIYQTDSPPDQRPAQTRIDGVRGQETTSQPSSLVVWAAAFQSLALVLVNTAIGVALSWLSALSITRGNVFSDSSPFSQSRGTFLLGVLLWVHLWFCFAVWIACSVSLIRLELLSHPGRRAGVVRALSRMFQKTVLWFLFSGAAVAGIGVGFGSVDPSYRKYRLEFYSSVVWNYSYVYVADQTARRIYRNETVEGRARQQQKRKQREQQEQQELDHPVSPRPRNLSQRLLSMLGSSAHFLSLVVPTLYVHIISFIDVTASAQFVWLFTLASLVFKVMMQEAAKLYIIRSNIQSPRTMATVVAVPTVLIDTQVRIVLQRFQDAQMAMSTTVAIAVAEVCVRICKTLLIKWHIHRHRQCVTHGARGRATSMYTQIITTTPTAVPVVPMVALAATIPANPAQEFELWRAQLQRYHAIEVNADMYAEYLAIGCSSAIMVMFGNHPQFLLTRASDSNSASLSPSSSWTSVSVHVQLLTQVAIEVVVDLVSCAVEVSSGLAFAHVNRERAYFFALCIGLAFVNVNISAVLNLAY